MSDQPTEIPEWATNDTAAEITEPSSADKLTGWVKDEQPGAQHMNWILHRIYLWILWFSNGIFQRSSLTNNTPIFQTSDRNGRPRSYLGPEGYWMGPVIEETYRWNDLDTAAPFGAGAVAPGLNSVVQANVEVFLLGGQSTAPKTCAPRCRIRIKDAATTQMSQVFPLGINGQNVFSNLDDCVFVVEGRATIDTIGANEVGIGLGIHEGGASGALFDVGTASAFAMFTRKTAIANWQCTVATGAAAATVVDSGVAIVADQYFTLRVELHGANTPVGVGNTTAAVARFFINGVEVAEITDAKVPKEGDGLLGPWFGGTGNATGPAADVDFDVSLFKAAWSETLDFVVPI